MNAGLMSEIGLPCVLTEAIPKIRELRRDSRRILCTMGADSRIITVVSPASLKESRRRPDESRPCLI